MDNARTLPGYKYYVAPDGSRPDVHVAFLDVAPDPGALVNGVCTPVDAAGLAELDARERNYVRVDVSDQVARADGTVWAYVGREDARRRLRDAVRAGRCVVQRAYAALVEEGFRARGEWERFRRCTVPERPPLRELRRVET